MAGPRARSTQNRRSSVHTEPCHAMVASTGAAAASASHAHGHALRDSLATTMPPATTPSAKSAARSGADWITKTSRRATCGPTIPTIATTSVTTATITTAPRRRTSQEQQGKQDIQLRLDGDRPEGPVGARRGEEVLHQQAVDDDRPQVGHALAGLRDDQPRHQRG